MTAMKVEDLVTAFNKAVIERAMAGEMNHHLGYRSGEDKPSEQIDERNGVSAKTLLTKRGSVRVRLPRDRDGSFEPVLIPRHERHFAGFDERIIALHARGLTVREIQAFLAEAYGTDVSPELISAVTDEVMAETVAWQNRCGPLRMAHGAPGIRALWRPGSGPGNTSFRSLCSRPTSGG